MATAYGLPGHEQYVDPFAVKPAPQPPVPSGPPITTGLPTQTTTPAPTTTPPSNTTPTTSNNTSSSSPQTPAPLPAQGERDRLAQAEADFQTEAKNVHDTILNIQNGTLPLNSGQMSQIAGLQQQFQALIDQQTLQNKGATGTGNIRGFQKGSAEYDPTFAVKTIGSIVSAGYQKIADLQIKEASAVAALTSAFKEDNIRGITDAYNIYKEASKARTDAIQKTVDETAQAIKEAQEAKIAADKVVYDTVTKPISDLAKEAAKNGAPQSILQAIQGAQDVGAAIEASQGYLQTATGDLGEYLAYRNQAQANGRTAAQFDDWLAAKDAADAAREQAKAYATSYASAAGKAAAEKEFGISSMKPLTESQGKDMTYAQRGEQSNEIINNLQGAILSMDPRTYAAMKLAGNFDLTNKYISNDMRQIRQAEKNFLTAVLRRESGAQIAPSEFATGENVYFPLPGDDAMTLAQKAQARETAINSFKANVPDYDTRVASTPSKLLDQSEEIAEQTLQIYTDSHPQEAAEMDARVAAMETSLGRPISAAEFLDIYPEYK